MNILHISTSDRGGAAKACLRLHEGLLKEGINSNVLVLYRYDSFGQNIHSFFSTNKKTLFTSIYYSLSYRLDKARKNKLYHRYATNKVSFSFPDTIYSIIKLKLVQDADVIHLHWVGGFLDYATFFAEVKKPVVWTLHDMNPILGGFHYTVDAENASKKIVEIEANLIKRKQKYLSQIAKMTVVSPSQWLFTLSSHSSLLGRFSNVHIPYGVEIDIFKPTDKEKARQMLSLPVDKKIILFIADSLIDKRKGFNYLLEAFKLLDQEDVILCTIGKSEAASDLPVYNLGFIADEHQIALVYSAADIFIIPSVEDNLPNTAIESMACGTPVIGFDTGGIPDMVRHQETGLVAKLKDKTDLMEKIHWLLMHDKERIEMGIRARQVVEQEYTLGIQALRYIELYREVLS